MKKKVDSSVTNKVLLSLQSFDEQLKSVDGDGYLTKSRNKPSKGTEAPDSKKSKIMSARAHILALEQKDKIIHNLRQQISKLKKAEAPTKVVTCPAQTQKVEELEAHGVALMDKIQQLQSKNAKLVADAALNESKLIAAVAEAKLEVMEKVVQRRYEAPASSNLVDSESR